MATARKTTTNTKTEVQDQEKLQKLLATKEQMEAMNLDTSQIDKEISLLSLTEHGTITVRFNTNSHVFEGPMILGQVVDARDGDIVSSEAVLSEAEKALLANYRVRVLFKNYPSEIADEIPKKIELKSGATRPTMGKVLRTVAVTINLAKEGAVVLSRDDMTTVEVIAHTIVKVDIATAPKASLGNTVEERLANLSNLQKKHIKTSSESLAQWAQKQNQLFNPSSDTDESSTNLATDTDVPAEAEEAL